MQVLAERLLLTPIFQNMTFIHNVQRLANVTKIAKFILPSIFCSEMADKPDIVCIVMKTKLIVSLSSVPCLFCQNHAPVVLIQGL